MSLAPTTPKLLKIVNVPHNDENALNKLKLQMKKERKKVNLKFFQKMKKMEYNIYMCVFKNFVFVKEEKKTLF
jgi:hypothetical protein